MTVSKNVDIVFKETLQAIDSGKKQIFDIAENTRLESERIKKELDSLQEVIVETIENVDRIEHLEKAARLRLVEVSKNFKKYTENDVREAYEKASNLQNQLATFREREHQMRARRTELERSFRKIQETLQKAESLVSQVGFVFDFLSGKLQGLSEELQQKQLLAPKIIKAQEEERRRVAREIHDGPAQSMANIVLRSEYCEKLMQKNPQQVVDELNGLKDTVKATLQEIRRIIFDLRPMALDDLGLVPTITRYLENLKEKYDIPVEFRYKGRVARYSSTIEVAIFRIIQEALNNAQKHAKAKMIQIGIDLKPDTIVIIVKDNGQGFDLEGFMSETNRDSFGLLGMKERIELLGGHFNIKSKIGQGTEIHVSIPLHEGVEK